MENRWDLFSRMDGWEEVSARLDQAFEGEVAKLDNAIESGVNIQDAVAEARENLNWIFIAPENDKFGSGDSEPRDLFVMRLKQHVKEKHNATVSISRFGDVDCEDEED